MKTVELSLDTLVPSIFSEVESKIFRFEHVERLQNFSSSSSRGESDLGVMILSAQDKP